MVMCMVMLRGMVRVNGYCQGYGNLYGKGLMLIVMVLVMFMFWGIAEHYSYGQSYCYSFG